MQLFDSRGVAHEPLIPTRLVSLVPSTTETLFALGCGEAIVGYTRFCVHPREQVTPDKWIGGTKNPKIDKIIALQPDLVLANREENRKEDIDALEAAGIRVWVAEPRTVTEAIDDIRTLGMVVGQSEAGERIAVELDSALSHTHHHSLNTPQTVAYCIWRDPYMVAGTDTFVANLLAEAGFTVPFAGRYPTVTIEELATVDHIFLASEPFPFTAKYRDELIERGVPAAKIHLVDGELLSWHGVRLREGLPYLVHLIESGK